MNETEICRSKYRRLQQLLEEDFDSISQGIQGEVLDAYRSILTREMDILANALKSLSN